jgi:hypothetical protein
MIPIIPMGAFCLILPEHKSWFTRSPRAIPPHGGEPAPDLLPSPVSIDPIALLFSLGETAGGPALTLAPL